MGLLSCVVSDAGKGYWKGCLVVKPLTKNTCLYNNQINAHALIGESAMVYCAGKIAHPQRICKSRAANSSRVFYQHPTWFISL